MQVSARSGNMVLVVPWVMCAGAAAKATVAEPQVPVENVQGVVRLEGLRRNRGSGSLTNRCGN